MIQQNAPIRLWTIKSISDHVNTDRWRVLYAIRELLLTPVATTGKAHVYSTAQVGQIKQWLLEHPARDKRKYMPTVPPTDGVLLAL